VKQFRPGKRVLVPPPPTIALVEEDLASGKASGRPLRDRPLPPLPATPRDLDRPEEAQAKPGLPAVVPTVTQAPTPLTNVQMALPVASHPMDVTAPAERRELPATAILHAKQGDTLAKLARLHKVPLGDLMRLNPDAVKALHAGDEVRLPGGVAKSKAVPAVSIHRVRKGDSLASIARQYGLDPGELRAWNHLKGDRIQVGQKLQLSDH